MKTTLLRPEVKNFPKPLRNLKQFVLWAAVPGGENGKIRKPPVCAGDITRHASVSDPSTWCSLQEAAISYETYQGRPSVNGGYVAGIGFVLTGEKINDHYLIGLDLDHCVDGEKVHEPAESLLGKFQRRAYVESSPSDRGLRIFGWSKKPFDGKKNGTEIYSHHRYLTLTGATWTESSEAWDDCTDLFQEIHRSLEAIESPRPGRSRLSVSGVYEPWRVYSALQAIDPDAHYHQWLSVLMALHSTGWDVAEEMAESWSRSGEKWNELDFRSKWRSFGKSESASKPVSLATLFDLARKTYGWNGSFSFDGEAQRYQKLEDERRTRFEIVTKKPPRRKAKELPEGLTRDLYQWASRRAYMRQPQVDLGVALVGTALMSRNRYLVTENFNTALQPYVLVSVPSGGGKEHMVDCLRRIAYQGSQEDAVISGFQSWHAMFDQLGQTRECCWVMDEFAGKMRGLRDHSQDASILHWVNELYGKGTGWTGRIRARGVDIPAMENPYLLLVGLAQPRALKAMVDNSVMQNGLISRMLLLSSEKALAVNHGNLPGLPLENRLINHFKRIEGDRIPIRMSQGVGGRFRDLRDASCVLVNQNPDVMGPVYARKTQQVLIVSGLLAIGRDAHQPEIDDECFDWALWFVERTFQNWSELLGKASSTQEGEARDKILECFALPENVKRSYSTRTPSALAALNDGLLPYRLISRRCSRQIRRTVFDHELEAMVLEETLEKVAVGKSWAYKLIG